MTLIQIEQNHPKTLERARVQIHAISTALAAVDMNHHWVWASGYVAALAFERLIDEDTKRLLEDEADQARDAWRSPTARMRDDV
ncbi:hypothetical protein H8F21_14140 [Pseudomonas sp. P66]|uniref:DUF3077 domain-containing protein n=1 Tax=Pseudomonas arcuscaelestis TaxID=2710591 RepID=A0ABS2C0Y8_9PSED|nr:hypothetical protein [Pseudomonas arcuscaelestis]MBM5458704.1 hypothetical protein [Pseudomonas arcuscaelestis]